MSRKKNKNQTLKRKQRLAKARGWFEQHKDEKCILHKYKKQFHVDNLCALK